MYFYQISPRYAGKYVRKSVINSEFIAIYRYVGHSDRTPLLHDVLMRAFVGDVMSLRYYAISHAECRDFYGATLAVQK